MGPGRIAGRGSEKPDSIASPRGRCERLGSTVRDGPPGFFSSDENQTAPLPSAGFAFGLVGQTIHRKANRCGSPVSLVFPSPVCLSILRLSFHPMLPYAVPPAISIKMRKAGKPSDII